MDSKKLELYRLLRRREERTNKLKKLDYKTLKYVEGELSEEEFTVVKTTKNSLRGEINAIDLEITNLREAN